MRSFALWYKPKEKDKDNKKIDVHINLWDKNRHKSNKIYCFDFGITVYDIMNIEEILLYAPFYLRQKNVIDLGSVISNNHNLVNAIFNENYRTISGEAKKLQIDTPKDEENFIIYTIEPESQIELESSPRRGDGQGTIVKIKFENINITDDIKKFYFRIRLKIENNGLDLISDEIKGLSLFENHFTTTEIIDFRLNDIRSCSEHLREKFEKENKFNIQKIHYLILRNASDTMIYHGGEMTSRMLEESVWSTYIEGTEKDIVAYHIKEKDNSKEEEGIKTFSNLVRFRYAKQTRGTII